MKELTANTAEAAREKHLPLAVCNGAAVQVKVGEVEHPMTEEHQISWVYLETGRGGQRKRLKPGEKPELSFALSDDQALAVYAYCTLHGLWKTTL
jgi:superoxide reductase